MLFLKNIQSVSKYESKLLYRSWFFKVFATLTVVATIFTAIGTLEESRYVESIPTLLGYSLMFTFNIGQAIVSIFLASEYLKRDKQLDTSEIFYVRPLSNAEYLLGKMWGTIRVFLLLNFIVMVVGVVCILAALYTFLSLRGFLILVFFVIGLVLTIVGWKMTGKLEGLGLMLVGIVLLLTALFVYNAPYRK